MQVGDVVTYITPTRQEVAALVVHVWDRGAGDERPPLLNLVFVSEDASREDSYGRQTEKSSSVSPECDSPNGRAWKPRG